jgi:predicted Fe-Mo cluster-binding NifX family protein
MKIAVVTEDGQTISQHFGRAPYYLVFTVEGNTITRRELRDKAGHRDFAGAHEHEHHHEHEHEHGSGPEADRRHARMIETITDCQVVLVRGMGRGAYVALEQAGLTPIVTDIADAEAAVRAYLAGDITNHTERLH